MTQNKHFCSAILFSLVLFSACSEAPKQIEKSAPIIETQKPLTKDLVKFVDGYKLTVVLSQKGCTACNVKIVQLVNQFIQTDAFGTVIETTGRNYDISSLFVEEFKDKIFKDYQRQLTKHFRSQSSYLVYHKNGIESDDVEKVEITVDNMDKFGGILKSFIKKAQSKA